VEGALEDGPQAVRHAHHGAPLVSLFSAWRVEVDRPSAKVDLEPCQGLQSLLAGGRVQGQHQEPVDTSQAGDWLLFRDDILDRAGGDKLRLLLGHEPSVARRWLVRQGNGRYVVLGQAFLVGRVLEGSAQEAELAPD